MLTDFYSELEHMNNVLMDNLSSRASIIKDGKTIEIKIILERKDFNAEIHGGSYNNENATAFVSLEDASNLEKRSQITIEDQIWTVIEQPELEDGLVKVTLGLLNEQSTAKSDIRY